MPPNPQLSHWVKQCLASATFLLKSIDKFKLSHLKKIEIFMRVVEEDFDHRDEESIAVFQWYRPTEPSRLNTGDK